MRYGRGVFTDQGRGWEKVRSLDVLLTSGREQILDELQRSLGVAGVIQHGGAEADRFPTKGLSRVGGEMDLSVVCLHCWIAQIDLIRQAQVGQSAVGGRTQIEEHGVDLTVLKLSEVKLVDLLRVGIAPQEARFEIGETIVSYVALIALRLFRSL